MKGCKPAGWQGAILVITLILCALIAPAHCQTAGIALLLQKSPFQGGTITPSEGIHHLTLNSEITLTAIPKPGYQFVYWLGDVSDPAASSTVTYLDKPKIIIAVFEQTEYGILLAAESTRGDRRSAGGGAAGGGAAAGGSVAFGGGGAAGGDGSVTTPSNYSRPPRPPRGGGEPEPPEPPPSNGDDPPAPEPPIPEPTTAVLLVIGSLFAITRRRPKKQTR